MDIRQSITDALAQACASSGIKVTSEEIPLEHTDDFSHGDYSSGVALSRAKAASMPPIALAKKIVAALNVGHRMSYISKIEIAGPGFINFYISSSTLADTLEHARSAERWGASDGRAGKRIMVEYTDPNPFKEFHIGHLMSNAVGESIVRLLAFSGGEMRRANYQGDVGPHVAKAIWGIRRLGLDPKNAADLGKAYAAGAQAYENDEQTKQEIDEINAKVYDRSDEQVNELYAAGRTASLAHFEELYKVLGTTFDYYFFESDTAPLGLQIIRDHPDVFEKSDGATVYKGEKQSLHTRVFITSKGLPTYEVKDLGLAKLKAKTWDFDESITITAHEQVDYFAVVLAAMRECLPEIAAKIKHVSHGMMRFADGKMSSRTGNVVTGESLLRDLSEAALARAAESRADDPKKLSQDIAVAAIKYQILRQAAGKDIIFDRERALSLDGDSGPYLQYTHARAQQVVARAESEGVSVKVDSDASPTDLARLLYRFPEIVARAAEEMEPHILANYTISFAAAFNRWYAEEKILDGTPAAAHKVAVADAVRATLKNCLWLLGIPAPEKM